MEKKRCPRCLKDKPIDKFGLDKWRKDGRNTYCKECRAEMTREIQLEYVRKNEARR